MATRAKVIKNKVTFLCPECFKGKTMDVSKYKPSDLPTKAKCKCSCGHSFTSLIEKRQYSRKGITLPGVYIRYSKGQEEARGQMLVEDLSVSGIKFSMNDRRTIGVGDKLEVIFNLDDQENSLVEAEVIIRHIYDLTIGAEFFSEDQREVMKLYLKGIGKNR
jgi:hypothetical protein